MDNRKSSAGPSRVFLPAVLASIALLLPACAAVPVLHGTYTPEELYRYAESLTGQTVTVRGKVEVVSLMCTEIACPAENPCCN
jgi:starvation-inducible outer membrane lipoprotein